MEFVWGVCFRCGHDVWSVNDSCQQISRLFNRNLMASWEFTELYPLICCLMRFWEIEDSEILICYLFSRYGICNKKFIFFLKALPKSHWEFCCFKYMSENATNSESIIRSLNVLWRVLSLNSILCFLTIYLFCARYCKEKTFLAFMTWTIFCKWYFEKFNLKTLHNY